MTTSRHSGVYEMMKDALPNCEPSTHRSVPKGSLPPPHRLDEWPWVPPAIAALGVGQLFSSLKDQRFRTRPFRYAVSRPRPVSTTICRYKPRCFLPTRNDWLSTVTVPATLTRRGVIRCRRNPGRRSPRVMAHPGLPQIQTCRLPASGSSSHDFAAQLKGLWTTRALGRPYRSSSRSKSDHERGLPRRRRDSHRFQICRAPRRKFWRLAMLPMIP